MRNGEAIHEGYSQARRSEWTKKTRGRRTENKISRKSIFKEEQLLFN